MPPERRRPLRVVDVALLYGERSGGIRTYLDAKRVWVTSTGAYEHHLVTPGERERHGPGRHELPAPRVHPNGYRLPPRTAALVATLRALRPDVVLLHDPFWAPRAVTRAGHALGARVVAVHHGSVDLTAGALPLPGRATKPVLRRWFRRAYREVDGVMSATPTRADSGRDASLGLRFGLDPAFRPRPGVARGDHVLYVGRLSPEKGVVALLEAAARAAEAWPLVLVGAGQAGAAVARRAARLGLAGRVSFAPFIADRAALALAYGQAGCVVMPGAHETFGLVAVEAAASGARVVCCRTAPSAGVVGPLAHTFAPGDVDGLGRAIAAARAAPRDLPAATALADRLGWPAALAAEHAALAALAGG